MNTLTYKGYIGSVAFSEKDGVFFGKIEGINGLVNFEGESVKELTHAFHEAVDDYLVYCEENNIEPHKSYSGSLTVKFSPETHSRIAILAKQAGVSINAFIKAAVEKQIAAMSSKSLQRTQQSPRRNNRTGALFATSRPDRCHSSRRASVGAMRLMRLAGIHTPTETTASSSA